MSRYVRSTSNRAALIFANSVAPCKSLFRISHTINQWDHNLPIIPCYHRWPVRRLFLSCWVWWHKNDSVSHSTNRCKNFQRKFDASRYRFAFELAEWLALLLWWVMSFGTVYQEAHFRSIAATLDDEVMSNFTYHLPVYSQRSSARTTQQSVLSYWTKHSVRLPHSPSRRLSAESMFLRNVHPLETLS